MAAAEDAPRGAEDREAHRSDRRGGRRRHVLRSASIVFDAGRCTMTCHILDTSETGARIMPADVLHCPDQFVLRPLFGPERKCEIIWRRGTKIGIRYV
jgi:hypothetical protein